MDDRRTYGEWIRERYLRLRGAALSRTARDTYWMGSSSVANGLLGAVASALLARSLGIDAFGTYALLLTIITLLADLGDLGLGSALVRFGAEAVARGEREGFGKVLSTVLRIKAVLAAGVIGGAALLLRPILGSFFVHVDPHITSYVFIALLAAALSIVAAIFPSIFQAFGDFRSGAVTSTGRAGARVVLIGGAMALTGVLTVDLVLWIEVASILVLLVAGALASPVRLAIRPRERALAHEILVFTRWVSLYQLITLLGTRIDVLVVGGLADARTLGLYAAAARIAGLVVAVTNSYHTVLLSSVAAAASVPDDLLRRGRQARMVTAGLAAGMLLLALLAPAIVDILYGAAYGEATLVLQIMCIGLVFTVLAYPLGAMLYARKQTSVFPLMAVLSAAGMIAGNMLFLPRFGAPGAAMAYSVSAVLAWAVAVAASLRPDPRSPSAPPRHAVR